MKEILIIPFLLAISLVSNAQTDTSSVEQYCEVIATPRLLSNKVTLEVNYGEEQSYWKDNRLKSEGTLKKFNSVIDALNYMGKEGWLFVNAFPITVGTTQIYHYGFKKSFLKSELK
jgi:hypothetical protein